MKIKDIHDRTYYELLDLNSSASESEIAEAYRRATTMYSSDNPALYHLFNEAEAEELQSLLDEAYSVLSDKSRRLAYDTNQRSFREGGDQVMTEIGLEPSLDANQTFAPSTSDEPRFARTRYGQYRIDDQFEAVIKSADEFPGPFIKKVRLYKNLNPDQIADATKVNRSYLTALEAHDFTALPAWVYVRGFITQLARLLGLDAAKVVASYGKIYKAYQGEVDEK